LAKAVGEIMIPVNDSRMEKGFNIGFNVGYSKALQAVLKVMEGTK
jgi:hypothetical protein